MQKSFPQFSLLQPPFIPLSILLFSYLHLIKITSSNTFFHDTLPPFSVLSIGFRAVFLQSEVKAERFPTNLFTSRDICSYQDKDKLSPSFVTLLFSSLGLSLSPCLSYHSVISLTLSVHPSLPSVIHLSLSQINMLVNSVCDR